MNRGVESLTVWSHTYIKKIIVIIHSKSENYWNKTEKNGDWQSYGQGTRVCLQKVYLFSKQPKSRYFSRVVQTEFIDSRFGNPNFFFHD